MSRGPLLLAIDTSSSRPGIVLAAPDSVLAEIVLDDDGRGESLCDRIPALVEDAGVDLAAVEYLAVARGPGSFTGIRVGLALARGLALVDDLPVVGVGSLELVALAAADVDRRLCAVLQAGQDKLYAAGYERGLDGTLREAHAPVVIPITELDAMLADWGGRLVLCAERYTLDYLRGEQAAKRPDRLVPVPESRVRLLASTALARRDDATRAEAVLPLYVAESAARPNRNRVVVTPDRRD